MGAHAHKNSDHRRTLTSDPGGPFGYHDMYGSGVITAVDAPAWISVKTEFVVDPDDPFPEGFTMGE